MVHVDRFMANGICFCYCLGTGHPAGQSNPVFHMNISQEYLT